MPQQVPSVSDELLASAGVYELDPNLPLLSKQVEWMLARSKSRLEGDRRDKKPPPYYLDGTKVLYPLGGVLAERARMQGQTPEQVREQARQQVRQGGWSFAVFLATGRLEDTWPIALVRGCPTDFFQTLEMELTDDEIGEIAEMSLGEYLFARLNYAEQEIA